MIQRYGPATAQEALSQFQSSAIETITLTVRTFVKTGKRKYYDDPLAKYKYKMGRDACKRIKIKQRFDDRSV